MSLIRFCILFRLCYMFHFLTSYVCVNGCGIFLSSFHRWDHTEFIPSNLFFLNSFFGGSGGQAVWLVESWFPDQGLTPDPWLWERGVLITGLPGNSSRWFRSGSGNTWTFDSFIVIDRCMYFPSHNGTLQVVFFFWTAAFLHPSFIHHSLDGETCSCGFSVW